jgi:penicillin amidase
MTIPSQLSRSSKTITFKPSQQALSSNEKEVAAVLKKWKGSNNLTDVAPTL